MKSRIEEEATKEIVSQCVPRILDSLHANIETRTFISIHRAAGLLEVSPETIKRLFVGRIVHIGGRQQRISLADIDAVVAERRTGSRPKAKAKKQAPTHPELFKPCP